VAEWSPEHVVDEGLARRLIGAQFPDVGLDTLEQLGEGWDATVWLAGGRWVFRFPRREVVLPGLARELQVLPQLAGRLPLEVPNPVHVGRPADGFPWPFWGARHVPGAEPSQVELTAEARVAGAAPLGGFLRALHAIDLSTIEGPALQPDANQRADMDRRVQMTRDRIAQARQIGLWTAPAAVEPLLEQALALPPAQPTALVHGDLHLRHLLLDTNLSPTGVIDWIDVCRADPAVDLMLYWSFLPPAGREVFRNSYGPIRDDQLVRSRVLAVFLSATLAVYGHEEDMAWLRRGALEGLELATTG
jgi:aminoglycoside phosphotransferase (APT) family kinase protein